MILDLRGDEHAFVCLGFEGKEWFGKMGRGKAVPGFNFLRVLANSHGRPWCLNTMAGLSVKERY